MMAKVGEHGEVPEVSKGELEDKCGLDLPKGGPECNGISDHARAPTRENVTENGKGKDNANGAVGDDPVAKDYHGVCVGNLHSGNKESEVVAGELLVEINGGGVQSCADGNCVANHINNFVVLLDNEESQLHQGGVQSCADGNCVAYGINNCVVLEGCESEEVEVTRRVPFKGHNGTVAVVDSVVHKLGGKVKAGEQIMVEASEDVQEIMELANEQEPEPHDPHQLDNGGGVQSCADGNCVADGINNGVVLEGSPGEFNEAEVKGSGPRAEHNGMVGVVDSETQKLDSKVKAEEQIMVMELADEEEPEPRQLNNEGGVQTCADGNCAADDNNNCVVLEGSLGESDDVEERVIGPCEEDDGTVGVVDSETHKFDSEVKGEEQIMVEPSVEAEEIMELANEESERHQLDNGKEKVEAKSNLDSDVSRKENQESQTVVTDKEPLELANGISMKDSLEDLGVDLEQNLKNDSCLAADIQLGTEAVSGWVSDENGDSLPTGSNSDLDIGVKENQDSQIMASQDVQIESDHCQEPVRLADENPAEVPGVDIRMDLEKNSETVLSPIADIQSEKVVNDLVPDEGGDCLPSGHAQDEVSESKVINDLVDADQNLPEQNESFGGPESLHSTDNCGSVSTECLPIPDSDTLVESDVGVDACVVESSPTCAVEDERLDADFEKSPAGGAIADIRSEKEVANDLVPNEGGYCLPSGHAQDGDSESEVINDLVDADQNLPEQNESFGDPKNFHSTDTCGNVSIESGEGLPVPDSDTVVESDVGVESCVVESSPTRAVEDERLEADVEKSPAGGAIADIQSKKEVVNDLVTDKSGDCLPSGHAQDEVSESEVINDLVDADQNLPEQNESFGDPESLHSTDNCGNISIESGECLPVPDSDTVVESDVRVDACVVENSPTCAVEDERLEADVEKSPAGVATILNCTANDARSETLIRFGSVDYECTISTFPNDDVNKESELSNEVTECNHPVPADNMDAYSRAIVSVKNESSLPTGAGAASEFENEIVIRGRGMPVATISESKVLSSSVATSENALNCVPDVVENGDQFTGDSCDKSTCQDAESVDGFHRAETPTSSHDDSTVGALEGQSAGAELEKRSFYYLIRIPRFDDENLEGEIQIAQSQVDEKTQSRDAIQAELQIKRATCKEYNDNFDAALSKERAVRGMLRSKRQEIDSVQSVINTVKNVISLEDIEGKIRNMNHMIEHETLPLKEERHLMNEIKKWKQLREQFSSNMGRQDEVQQALDQKDQVDERLKLLRKEADLLRDSLSKAEAVTTAAKKKKNDEFEKLHKLQVQFRAENDIRQNAYAHLQSLRKQLNEKNKYLWKYKNDAKAAYNHARNKDRESLQNLCDNQVETIMELWNKNDEFRKEYVRCNNRSTLRRLRTLDGRSLGPDEEPPVIPNVVNQRVTRDNSVTLNSTPEIRRDVPVDDDRSMQNVAKQKNDIGKTIKPTKSAYLGNEAAATVSGRDEPQEVRTEERKRTKEEEELARKAEELRKEEEAANLKEQRCLEEKAKAKEAMERKKRNADKALARAALRAQKEAELKEKEKEKKARKKERKSAAGGEATNEGESGPRSETPSDTLQESETTEKPVTTKRPRIPSRFIKQTKVKSIPPPLRIRGKRRMQPWMWIVLIALLVFVLFLVGNTSIF